MDANRNDAEPNPGADGFFRAIILRRHQVIGLRAVDWRGVNIDPNDDSFILANSVIYNHLPWNGQEAGRMQFVRNFYRFFVEVLRCGFQQWDEGRGTPRDLNEETAVRVLNDTLGENFYRQRMQRDPWLLGIDHLGVLVHRDIESQRWSRVADAEDIITREGYVNLLIVPHPYNGRLDGWLRRHRIDMGALLRERFGEVDTGAQRAAEAIRPETFPWMEVAVAA